MISYKTWFSAILINSVLVVGCGERRPSIDIFEAIERKGYRESEVRDMINADPALLSTRDEISRTPMYMLAGRGRTSMVELCLDKGTDVNQLGYAGHTALSAACHSGHYDTAKLLISRGADPNITAEDGETPLHQIILAQTEYFELFTFLVENGASLNIRTDDGQSLLGYCRKRRALYEKPDYSGSKSLQKRLVDAHLRLEAYIETRVNAR